MQESVNLFCSIFEHGKLISDMLLGRALDVLYCLCWYTEPLEAYKCQLSDISRGTALGLLRCTWKGPPPSGRDWLSVGVYLCPSYTG